MTFADTNKTIHPRGVYVEEKYTTVNIGGWTYLQFGDGLIRAELVSCFWVDEDGLIAVQRSDSDELDYFQALDEA